MPSKIICVGRNYREHAKELGNEVPTELVIFLKPPSAVIGPGAAIVRPRISRRVDYEGELAVVIGKLCRHVRGDEDVRPYILRYTCVNDVTARDLQPRHGPGSYILRVSGAAIEEATSEKFTLTGMEQRNGSHALLLQGGDVLVGNDAAYDQQHVIHLVLPQQVHHPRHDGVVRAREDGQTDDIYVFFASLWLVP